MSKSWTFSPSSEPYLQRCITAAPHPDPNNKWFQKFGMKDSVVAISNITEKTNGHFYNRSIEMGKDAGSCEEFFETIESEQTLPIEYIVKECYKNPALITTLGEKLSINKAEQLFKHIFSKKDEDNTFLSTFITNFLPIQIKTHNSRLCMDVLVKLSEDHSEIFKNILEILMNDTEIPNQILNSYTAALNENSAISFMKTLSLTEITLEGFIHNMLIIYTAYKISIKNDQTQNYIQKIIIQHSKNCVSDRNFGRLFLTYLQSEKALERKVSSQILECLDAHRSPFKRPCFMLLQELNT